MIASDRVRLDGLIHQWEEKAARERAAHLSTAWCQFADGLEWCANELRAALLVLGDARPQVEDRHDSD